jgi:uncharacterized membrane protein (UPF0127 family)
MSDVVFIKSQRFPTLVALTEDEQRQGLMWKRWPPPVMAFPYDAPGIRKFWMKNTISPLDIIFCRGEHVVGVYRGEPLSTAAVGPDEPVDLVVELPAGQAEEYGIRVGDDVRLKCSPATIAKKILG